MKRISLPLGLAVLTSIFSFQLAVLPVPSAAAAPPPEISATITFANGETVKLFASDRFRPVSVAAGETVTIQTQLPQQLTTVPAVVQALDGGTSTDIAIAPDGSASMSFQAGSEPGLYRLLFSARGRTAVLQFQVPGQG